MAIPTVSLAPIFAFFFSVNPVCPIFLSIKIEKSDSYSSSAKNMNINDDSNGSPGPACKLFVCSSSFCTSLRDLKKEKNYEIIFACQTKELRELCTVF